MEQQYELKLASGKTVIWVGLSGEDAARRYVDAAREDNPTVVAWRHYPRTGVFPISPSTVRIIE